MKVFLDYHPSANQFSGHCSFRGCSWYFHLHQKFPFLFSSLDNLYGFHGLLVLRELWSQSHLKTCHFRLFRQGFRLGHWYRCVYPRGDLPNHHLKFHLQLHHPWYLMWISLASTSSFFAAIGAAPAAQRRRRPHAGALVPPPVVHNMIESLTSHTL